MAKNGSSGDEIVSRGQRLYEEHIRGQVEADHRGDYLVINVDTGEYEVGPDDLQVSTRARERFGSAPMFTMRVGLPAAYRLGSTVAVRHS